MITKAILLLLLLLASSFPAGAKVHEKINVEACAKIATDIVIATEGDSIDGQLIVLETLKGSLQAGEYLVVPELAIFSSKESRVIEDLPLMTIRPVDLPKKEEYVTGSRMILFLRKNPTAWDGENKFPTGGRPLWLGIDDQGFYQSAIWIEDNRTFAFYDMNSTNGKIISKRGTLADFECSEELLKVLINVYQETEARDPTACALRIRITQRRSARSSACLTATGGAERISPQALCRVNDYDRETTPL